MRRRVVHRGASPECRSLAAHKAGSRDSPEIPLPPLRRLAPMRGAFPAYPLGWLEFPAIPEQLDRKAECLGIPIQLDLLGASPVQVRRRFPVLCPALLRAWADLLAGRPAQWVEFQALRRAPTIPPLEPHKLRTNSHNHQRIPTPTPQPNAPLPMPHSSQPRTLHSSR